MPPSEHLYLAADPETPPRQRSYHAKRWGIYMDAMRSRKVIKTTRGIVLTPVKGQVPPVEVLLDIPDAYASVIDLHKGWSELDRAIKTAYAPGDSPADRALVVRTLRSMGIYLPGKEIIGETRMRSGRLPFDMPIDYRPLRPMQAVPRGQELIDLTRERIFSWSEWALRPWSGWDSESVHEWVQEQDERLDLRERNLRGQEADCEGFSLIDDDPRS